MNVGKDGTINGVYSNGVVSPLASLAIAGFTNPAGLLDIGDHSVNAERRLRLSAKPQAAGYSSVRRSPSEKVNAG